VGDWRYLLQHKKERGAVTPEDIIRVAKKYLNDNNRTVATLVKKKSEKKITKVKPDSSRPHY